MSNTIATITSNTQALVWTTKKGVERRADSATAQAFAPRAARLSAAQQADMQALVNGQYRPFMASVRASLTKAETAALVNAADFSLAPTKKAGVLDALRAIDAEWARSAAVQASKGKKPTALRAALHETLSAWIQHEDTQAAIKAAGLNDAPSLTNDSTQAPSAESAPAADTGADTAPADTQGPATVGEALM